VRLEIIGFDANAIFFFFTLECKGESENNSYEPSYASPITQWKFSQTTRVKSHQIEKA
jgi:hypothetical protein